VLAYDYSGLRVVVDLPTGRCISGWHAGSRSAPGRHQAACVGIRSDPRYPENPEAPRQSVALPTLGFLGAPHLDLEFIQELADVIRRVRTVRGNCRGISIESCSWLGCSIA
jgi:hypothetical protein